ncbi:TetR/AcrR family transcriptional regulator [Hamadaea tsunoensis]|uniref:TetR/AcrR family transcriptional regulator n=1 Tax=Hamadaea tsunoensis TaxID=53368 RepID=UPI0004200E5C|nr:TetR-like C-terminal domain-containing protein [Hamadaea tsunoensis]
MASVKGDLIDRLVDEGARLLVAEGLGGLSLRKVAAAAGVSTMPVYTLFGDKRGLLAAMHREAFRRLGAALAAAGPADDPLQHLGLLGFAYRQSALDGPHLYALMFGQVFAELPADEDGRAAADAAYLPLVDGVRAAQTAGILAEGDPEPVALHLWAVAHGMVSLEINGHLPALGDPADMYAIALNNAIQPFLRM